MSGMAKTPRPVEKRLSWRKLKAWLWDEQFTKEPPGKPFMYGFVYRPPLRRVWCWLDEEWRREPLKLLGVLAALIGALAALISALR